MNYSQVLQSFFFSLHSRRLACAVLGSAVAWAGWRYGIPGEVQGAMVAPLVAFILGESYRDGKAASSATPDTVNVGSAQSVNTQATPSTPAPIAGVSVAPITPATPEPEIAAPSE